MSGLSTSRKLLYGTAMVALGAMVAMKYNLPSKLTGIGASKTAPNTISQKVDAPTSALANSQSSINRQKIERLTPPSFYLRKPEPVGSGFTEQDQVRQISGDPFSGIKDPDAAVEEPVANKVLDPMQAGQGDLPNDLLPGDLLDDLALPDMGLPDMDLPELGLNDLGLNLDEAGLPKDLATEPLAEPENPNPDGELDLEAALLNLEIQKEPEVSKPEVLPKREPKKVTILHPKPLPPPEPPNLAYKGFMKIGGQTIALVSYQNRNLRLKQNQPLTDGWKILRIDRKFLLLTHPQSGAERMVKRN